MTVSAGNTNSVTNGNLVWLLGSVEYDESCDASYVVLFPGPKVARTVELIDQRLLLDLDAEGRLIGIEVLGATDPLIPPEASA